MTGRIWVGHRQPIPSSLNKNNWNLWSVCYDHSQIFSHWLRCDTQFYLSDQSSKCSQTDWFQTFPSIKTHCEKSPFSVTVLFWCWYEDNLYTCHTQISIKIQIKKSGKIEHKFPDETDDNWEWKTSGMRQSFY